MKFWYALHKNLTSQPGRFSSEVGGSPRPEECLPEAERDDVLGTCTSERAALQAQFENQTFQDVVNFIKTDADVLALPQFISNQSLTSGQLNLDPNLPENVRTAVTQSFNAMPFIDRLALMPPNIIDDVLRLDANGTIALLTEHPEDIKQLETPIIIKILREISVNPSISLEAREIIINQAKESDLVRFISTNPKLIPELCVTMNGNTATVNFYSNSILEKELSPSQLFPDQALIRARVNGATYRMTANGFRAFYQADTWTDPFSTTVPVNEKAFAVDGSVFEIVTSDEGLTEEEDEALNSLEGNQILAPPTEISENYQINQAYVLNFKMLASELSHNLPEGLPSALQTDIQKQAKALRVFLDGKRFLLEGEPPTRYGYSKSVLAGVSPIDYNASPADVQAATEAALFRIIAYIKSKFQKLRQDKDIRKTNSGTLLAETKAMQAISECLGNSMETLIKNMQADSIAIRDQNQLSVSNRLESYGLSDEIIQGYWEQLDNPKLSSLEKESIVNQILGKAETSFRNLDTTHTPESEIQTLIDSLRRDLLTHARNSDAVDQSIQLTESLKRLKFLNNYRHNYFDKVFKASQDLGLDLPASLSSAFASDQFDLSHVNALEDFVKNNQDVFRAYLRSPEGRNVPWGKVIRHFLNKDATAEFRTQLVEINQSSQQRVDDATDRREANIDWVRNANHQLTYFQPDGTRDLSTPEAQIYHQKNDERAQAYTQLQGSTEFKQQSPSVQAALYDQIYRVPSQTNLVGLTSSGQYILEAPSSDQTTYLQNPSNGTIIAEQLTGVPDSEDLRVPPEEWATAQALGAMTESFVIKSAAELAQAGETLGNMALVNFMRQYWGIRGRNTLPESELDQFKSLGAMMSDNHINLHTVLQQLNAIKWDETAAGNRAVNVRYQFNKILAAAAAGNNTGFRELLRLDELPSDEWA